MRWPHICSGKKEAYGKAKYKDLVKDSQGNHPECHVERFKE